MERVAILLAIYRPNMDYLAQQLESLQRQTYQNCFLYIRDDSDDDEWFLRIGELVQAKITQFPYQLVQNDTNIGSTKTFELLTQEAQGDYFVYCDQDDVWHENKIERLMNEMHLQKGILTYSDLRVIDQHGEVIANSFARMNKRIVHQTGNDAFSYFLRRNCVTGCAMMIDATIAQAAVPFLADYIHDHWLALVSSQRGKLVFVNETLVDYRIHEQNQIGKTLLKNIETKADYIPLKLLPERAKLNKIEQLFHLDQEQLDALHLQQAFVSARIAWFEKPSWETFKTLKSMYHLDAALVIFEMSIRLLPNLLVKHILRKIKQ